jgi:hypothetical protein
MRVRASLWVFVVSVVGVAAIWGCGEEGVTPKACPPLPLYDIQTGTRDDGLREDAAQRDAIQAGVDVNCVTPIGTAKSGELAAGGTTTTVPQGGAGGQGGG